jgi:large subunit ribosomal protein L5
MDVGFLGRLMNTALPNARLSGSPSRSFDGRGNFTLGLRERRSPEISYDQIKRRGLEVSIVTTARTDRERRLLELWACPSARGESAPV